MCAMWQDVEGIRIPFGYGIAGAVAVHGDIVNIEGSLFSSLDIVFPFGQPWCIQWILLSLSWCADAYSDRRFNREVDVMTGFKTRSVLCLPVRLGNTAASQTLAVLQVLNKTGGGGFDDADIEMMQTFCMEVAFALKRKSVESLLAKVMSEGSRHEQVRLFWRGPTAAFPHCMCPVALLETTVVV